MQFEEVKILAKVRTIWPSVLRDCSMSVSERGYFELRTDDGFSFPKNQLLSDWNLFYVERAASIQ